jgi:hypothetical protein
MTTATTGKMMLMAAALLAVGHFWAAPSPAANVADDAPRGTAIDGSEDTSTTLVRGSGTFSDLDAAGARAKVSSSSPLAIPENQQIKDVQHNGATYSSVNFGTLAGFKYLPPKPFEMKKDDTQVPLPYRGQIPKPITELSGKPTAVTGFVIPLEVEKGKLKSFILVRNQLYCCYGMVPAYNEWIHVTGKEGFRAPFLQDVPVTVYGTFTAGEVLKQGQLVSLYRMEAADVAKAGAL